MVVLMRPNWTPYSCLDRHQRTSAGILTMLLKAQGAFDYRVLSWPVLAVHSLPKGHLIRGMNPHRGGYEIELFLTPEISGLTCLAIKTPD
jgi:hypothetical protein